MMAKNLLSERNKNKNKKKHKLQNRHEDQETVNIEGKKLGKYLV